MDKNKNLGKSIRQAAINFSKSIPIILGVILLLGLFKSFISQEQLAAVFSGNPWCDTLVGSFLGSVSAGQVINSYIIGGELLDKGVSLFAVTAFLLAWVTVGIIQIPAEIAFLGNKFAIIRNLSGIFLAMLVAILVVLSLEVIS